MLRKKQQEAERKQQSSNETQLLKRQTIKECLVYDIDLVSNMIDFTETISKYINN